MVLDVFDGVFAWGVLLVPADALLATDSDWPVVVCQHGLEGLPSDTIGEEGSEANYDAYKAFTRRLAERGFVTFAPHNPCESPALPVSLRVAGAAMRRVIPELGMQQPSGNTEA